MDYLNKVVLSFIFFQSPFIYTILFTHKMTNIISHKDNLIIFIFNSGKRSRVYQIWGHLTFGHLKGYLCH